MRNKKEYTVTAEGRDKGKIFVITEMHAVKGEDWAIRAIRLAQKGGADVPGGLNAGIAGIAAIGILAILQGGEIDELRPLFREMLSCVELMTDRAKMHTRPIIVDSEDDENNDIQEIKTLLLLRKEWLDLHLDFSIADALSKLTSGTASADSSTTRT